MNVRRTMRCLGKIAAIALLGSALNISPAFASGPNYGKCEEIAQLLFRGYVQIQASYNDGGLHMKQGWHRFQRSAGPTLDTGHMFTAAASSPSDSQIYSHTYTVWDSPLSGDAYTTHWSYGFIHF